MELKETDRVSYWDGRTTRIGTIIEMQEDGLRARIKWDENRPRTWIRTYALVKL